MSRLHRRIAAALTGALLACGTDFDPPSYLDNLRVLALEASPLEVGPGEQVTLRPVLFVPEGRTLVEQRWRFCPISLGPRGAYACVDPRCEVALTPDASGAVSADPVALAGLCVQALGGPGPGTPAGAPAEVPEQVETIFTFTATTDDGQVREAVERVPVWTRAAPPARNRPPAFARVEIEGLEVTAGGAPTVTARPEQKLQVRVLIDPASLDLYVDASGATQTEDPVVSFYATAGRFEGDRTNGVDSTLKWTAEKLEAGQVEARIFLVARDLRGGQSVAGPYRIAIAR